MGQAISGSEDTGDSKRQVQITSHELDNLFTKKCLSQLLKIETFAIKSNLNISDLNQDTVIDEQEFIGFLHLQDVPQDVVTVLFQLMLRVLEFPELDATSTGSINVVKLLRMINLFNEDRFNKIFNKDFDYTEFIIVALSLSCGVQSEDEKHVEKDKSPISATIINNKLSWSSIDYYSKLDIESLTVPSGVLQKLFTFCLSVSLLSLPDNNFALIQQFAPNFENKSWKNYEKCALSLIKTISVDEQDLKVLHIVQCIKSSFPQMLSPLSHILNSMLVMPSQVAPEIIGTAIEGSSIVNEYTLSQLATFLPIELCYSKMRKLYVGKEYGFSMRSFESKVMKWNAPTILFVSGTRINPLKKKLTKGAETFLYDEYPRFKPTNDTYGTGSDKLTFGVYVRQPWKLSNKETFGDSNTVIFQISPQQQLFKGSRSPGKKFVYFSTFNNGGIGFGCDLPVVKNGVTKYQPGNVSLLIDGGLEFCAFRHIGQGGSFETGSGYSSSAPEYEDKFIISDLEVYGVGTDKEIQEQLKQWEWEKKEAEARQRINIKNLGEERLFLEMAGLVGNAGGNGGSM